jgi:hypothetical protein
LSRQAGLQNILGSILQTSKMIEKVLIMRFSHIWMKRLHRQQSPKQKNSSLKQNSICKMRGSYSRFFSTRPLESCPCHPEFVEGSRCFHVTLWPLFASGGRAGRGFLPFNTWPRRYSLNKSALSLYRILAPQNSQIYFSLTVV